MKKVYIIQYSTGAGKWIYDGYARAWEAKGFEVVRFFNLSSAPIDNKEPYYVMATDSNFSPGDERIIAASQKTFIFAQPNSFPLPWGNHPNFISMLTDRGIKILNNLPNVVLWSWLSDTSFHTKWKNVHTVPLAFDNLYYKEMVDEKYSVIDICFVGGLANNGFNEKIRIMNRIFKEFEKSDLKCGFFVNKGLSHEQETKLICNSKVTLNIHDLYQRTLGLDTNERTFKSLGLNGLLVSDDAAQLSHMFPEVLVSNEPNKMVDIVKNYVNMSTEDREIIKRKGKELINKKHRYFNRVEKLLCL
jgi:hypothetical protein